MSEELRAFLEFIDTNSPTDEYTKCLANAVQKIKKDEGARDLYMTVEQEMMEVREEMREKLQQYVDAANKRASAAEQEAARAKEETTKAKQKAANAEQKANKAIEENIANIIGMCRNFDYSNEKIIQQLMERASLTYDEAVKALTEY